MNRKYIHYLFVIISLFFIGILPVSAKENCTSVKSRLDLYDSYEETLKNTDCTDTSDVTIVNTCNDANVQKNLIITELMKLKEQGKICENEKTKVDKIIDDNKDTCGQIFDDDFNNFVNNALTMFYVIGPILLILFGSLDYAKATTSTEKDALKKANIRFAKRVAATLLLFLTPTIINLILSLNVSDKYLSGNAYTCDYKYLIYNKKYNIKYIAKTTSSKKGSTSTYKRCTGSSCPTYIWPLDASSVYVTDPFGNRVSPTDGASSKHNGIDIGASYGGNVYAVSAGIVTFSQYNDGAGNQVTVQSVESNGATLNIEYLHNSELLVSVGDKVNQGDVIAHAGSTGVSTGAHCHLRVTDVNTGISYNPLLYLYGGTANIRTVDGSTINLVNFYSTDEPETDDWLENYSLSGGVFTKVNNK